MTHQETSVRITRAAKRRAEEAMLTPDQKPKTIHTKRVALGELPNLSNIVVSMDSKEQNSKARPRVLTKKKIDAPFVDAESDDPQIDGPHVAEIYSYLRKMEAEPKRRPLGNYIETVQKDVSSNMRGVLVDWLVEVAEEYKLLSDTLYLTISHIDRFLSCNIINRQRLQLLGVSAMLIASKYEETTPPRVEDFCYITDNTYSKEEVVKMESDILKSLRFEMGNPTVNTFLRKFTEVAQEDCGGRKSQQLLESMGCYLAELSLLDYRCVKFLPSLVAASVMFLARFIVCPKVHPWSLEMQRYSGYKPADLKQCVLTIHDLYLSRTGGGLQAVREKYRQQKFRFVAKMPSPPKIPASLFEDIKAASEFYTLDQSVMTC